MRVQDGQYPNRYYYYYYHHHYALVQYSTVGGKNHEFGCSNLAAV